MVRYIAPAASGSGDGSSWDDAAGLQELPDLVAGMPHGGEVRLRADAGPYALQGRIELSTGGTSESPVVVRGVDAAGEPARAQLQGDRTRPYSPDGDSGHDLFVLQAGASHLAFRDLAVADVGNAFLAAGDVSDVVITDTAASNVRRFFENDMDSGATSADVSGLTLRDITVDGFSKRVLRLRYDSHDVLVEDVHGDSEQQDGDDFAIGVHLEGTVHDVVLRRVTMENIRNTQHEYWNGDGFATEREVHDIAFEDTTSRGNTDAGYDLKSSRTTLTRAVAEDNKRNYRLWGTDVALRGCRGLEPHKRGGTGSQVQVWLGEDADVTLRACTFTSTDPATIVFDAEPGARASATGGSIDQAGDVERLSDGASVDLRGVAGVPQG